MRAIKVKSTSQNYFQSTEKIYQTNQYKDNKLIAAFFSRKKKHVYGVINLTDNTDVVIAVCWKTHAHEKLSFDKALK